MRRYLTPECDNKSNIHDMVELPGEGGIRAFCRNCKRVKYLRTNTNGAPNKREYAKYFYRWIIQPNKPLYYKVHPNVMQLGHNIEL